jgi:hypothetical protein
MADVVRLWVIYFRYSECKCSYAVYYIDCICGEMLIFQSEGKACILASEIKTSASSYRHVTNVNTNANIIERPKIKNKLIF